MEPVTSGSEFSTPAAAPKGRRFAAAFIDLFIIPIFLGLIVGLVILTLPDAARSVILVLVNVAWLVFRDVVYSPGRAMVGLKIVSLTGSKVTVAQAFIRNILLVIPFLLIVGYIVEIIALMTRSERVADGWAKTRVIVA
ncbi:MAG: RDD family protein [Candidatus Omnitrophica bacterium]|nr:RDD family protein [Candidatus Omnitrophota bacterium]